MEVRPLAVLVAEQVATHTPEEEVMKLAKNHMNLINGTGEKRKEDKGKDATPPTPTQT